MTTRTLLTEIDLPNPAGTLLSGSYAEVHLKIPSEVPTYLIPVNTLIFRSAGFAGRSGAGRKGSAEDRYSRTRSGRADGDC